MNEKELINKLVVFDISQNLHHGLELIQTYEISEEEIELLCKVASIKSLSDDSEEQSLAYEIITKLFKNFGHWNLSKLIIVICSFLLGLLFCIPILILSVVV